MRVVRPHRCWCVAHCCCIRISTLTPSPRKCPVIVRRARNYPAARSSHKAPMYMRADAATRELVAPNANGSTRVQHHNLSSEQRERLLREMVLYTFTQRAVSIVFCVLCAHLPFCCAHYAYDTGHFCADPPTSHTGDGLISTQTPTTTPSFLEERFVTSRNELLAAKLKAQRGGRVDATSQGV